MAHKTYDGNLYFFFGIISLSIVIILGAISSYSKFIVEPEIRGYLEAPYETDDNYKNAYILLRKPQIFAGYEHFDAHSIAMNKILETFDQMIYAGLVIPEDYGQYLEILLKRREDGAMLGFKTALFVFILSMLSWVMFFIERKDLKKYAPKQTE
ncbi:MAG: hypothetical protein FWG92_03580 [Leptospirales bacterium]|nr:hypothetical protein [Leptospirales bacterium]